MDAQTVACASATPRENQSKGGRKQYRTRASIDVALGSAFRVVAVASVSRLRIALLGRLPLVSRWLRPGPIEGESYA